MVDITPNDSVVVAAVQQWLDDVVIGLGLCPFAAAPRRLGNIGFEVCNAQAEQDIAAFIDSELQRLVHTPVQKLETSLLITPYAFAEFEDYNQFLSVVDTLIGLGGLSGQVQVASFHPRYCFEGSSPQDQSNLTNCSPYPIFHLIREASLTRVLAGVADPDAIPERNIQLTESLADGQIRRLFPYWVAK